MHVHAPPRYQVTNGKNAMPAFGERIANNDIEESQQMWWMTDPSLFGRWGRVLS